MNKSDLRSQIRAIRKALPPDQLAEESAAITQHLCSWLEQNRPPGGTVGLYLATNNEANIDAVAEWLWEREIQVAAPRVDLQHQVMTFHPFLALPEAAPGPFGVRQPPATEPVEPNLILVPGVAFDLHGGRLGLGGGWYDRTLTGNQYCIGVALRCQVVDSIPREPHDRLMNALVTPDGWYEFQPL